MIQGSALKTASFLLLLASITQGFRDVPVFHYKTKEALVGQNVSLPCFFENIGNMTYVSSEWKRNSSKLALHNSIHGYSFFSPNVTLKTIKNGKDQLIGTRLEFPNTDKGDTGTYICEIGAFPIGNHRRQTELRIKDMIECDRNSIIEVHSGENVTIHCHEFASVTYTWTKEEVVVSNSPSLHLLSVSVFNAGLYTLSVHTGNSLLHKEFSITVSSQSTDYYADASTLSPDSSSNENETTTYSPVTTFATENTQKATTTIPISNSQPANLQNTTDTTMYHTSNIQSESYNTTLTVSTVSEHFNQSLTSKGFGQSETYNTTLAYNQSESFDTVSIGSEHFNQLETFNTSMSYNHPVTNYTTQPYVNDASFVTVDYDSALNEAESTTSPPTTFLGIPTVEDTSDVTDQQGPADNEESSHLGLTLLIIGGVLLIIGALFLYRRRVLKKRGDLPPPFKPPPPPVKYTAVRTAPQSFPTDRCNSITMPISMEKRQAFV
ncbi:hypothetical protein NL108_005691 [Boleophthalmus pectinirostris]|uniref:T-cell surface protein tactile n=1 Tax=Boleophthalmus pectinirostris TaxID=150288 RepID=UPI00242BE573|nr:T-cell surface protein tactile [Boleophthalmus pectinirostris]KAJ0061629.1 hypothetical protein NL108_005691 [Boleophthalmus pectinirostris]